MKKTKFILITAVFLSCSFITHAKKTLTADVIIYGGTSAAVISAVEIVQSGKTAIVVSPDKHLGGLTSGGLGRTDSGNTSVIGGLARDFYQRIWAYYKDSSAWNWEKQSEYKNLGQAGPAMNNESKTMWIFEPHVAEKIFEDYITENKITVYRNEWLDRSSSGLRKKEGKIISFKTLSGKIFSGKVFIDASYEGDLMASAGVKYHVGRESNTQYKETLNGVQPIRPHLMPHFFSHKISPYKIPGDSTSGVLPLISTEKLGEYGSGDNKVQAYCFRMCLTNVPENRVPFPKPANYDPAQYELLARFYTTPTPKKGWRRDIHPIPNFKTDTNNDGPLSTDNLGMNYDYPEASYERRAEIIQQHHDYQAGMNYFMANDPRVPEELRKQMNTYGLAKDEFIDNGNWPHQLYIREARRMIGEYVTIENDVLRKREVPSPVGMGSYTLDSHNVQRYITSDGFVQNEGIFGKGTGGPYPISYRSLIPKREECTNLLVPVCVSSTHVAYGSIRMEPVFMILGQSAAVAACIAIDDKLAIQDVPYGKLREVLDKKKQVCDKNAIPKVEKK